MHKGNLVFVCLACIGHGRRMQTSLVLPGTPDTEDQQRLKEENAAKQRPAPAALLAASNPPAAFQLAGAGAPVPGHLAASSAAVGRRLVGSSIQTSQHIAALNPQGRVGRSEPVMAATDGPALLLDCDGTLVETERDGHRVSFNQAFKEVGIDAEWDVALYGDLLTTGGGKERMTRYFLDYNPKAWPHPEPPSKDHPAIMDLHKLKTKLFMDIVKAGKLQLREGVKDMLTAAKAAGWTLAVCSTSNEKAVQAVVDTNLPEFAAEMRVFAGDVVKAKKPDPAIYNLAATELGLDPSKVIVVEDTNIGLLAGKAAGMKVLVTRSIYSEDEDFTGADFNVANAEAISFAKDLAPLITA
mmetsp:Transcript_154967/g.269486  ORF Transcript_154967/g.269486 Transcript_154967/m.269486 type:complete len:355 (-) Transcript_154967:55-1119(-)